MSRSLTSFAWLSIIAAVLTIALKTGAYVLTGSVGLLSDALESLVNLVGALMALAMLTIAARPEDEDHPYGHGKAEYFSSGVEGTLIMIAAIIIAVNAVPRLIHPIPLEQVGLGLQVSVLASLINLCAALRLLRAGKEYNSITLQANAHHLLTDVWTSAGVIIGVGITFLTGWERTDPVVALIVAGNILWSGLRIIQESVAGLMDVACPPEELALLKEILNSRAESGIEYHALRTRCAGSRRFVSFHLLVPGFWTVQHGHHLSECIEDDIRKALPNIHIITHLESLNDPASWKDISLNREKQD